MRKGMAQGLARPTLSDRNPVPRAFSYQTSGVAPHGLTTRWTYTVPAGKKFQVGLNQLLVIRDAVAGTVGLQFATMQYTPSGGATTPTFSAYNLGNVVNNSMNTVGQSGQVLNAGDAIIGQTQDSSITGTGLYSATLVGTEGDA